MRSVKTAELNQAIRATIEALSQISQALASYDETLPKECEGEVESVCKQFTENISDGNLETYGCERKKDFEDADIWNFLLKLGYPVHVQGFEYAITTLKLMLQYYSKNEKIYFTQNLYPEVGKKYKVDSRAVERCLRYGLKLTLERNAPFLKELYNGTVPTKLTMSAFLTRCAQYLYNNM